MNPQELSGGIPSRVTGLTAGVLRHTLSLGALAAEEGRILIRQSVSAILLLTVMALTAMIAYVALAGALISLLATRLSWGWPVSLSAAGLLHLAALGILFKILRARTTTVRPFEATSAELRKDIDALASYTRRSP
jgi:hypothetical protein